MGLNWRDGVGTLLVAAAVAVTLSVISGWSWPLIDDARAGVIALFVLGYASCLVAQAPTRMAAALRRETPWTPFIVIATMLGTLALGPMIAGVILNNVTVLVAVASVVFAIWFVTTVHHLVEAGPRPSMPAWKEASLWR